MTEPDHTADLTYRVPTGRTEAKLVEKASKFIGFCLPAETEQKALDLLAEHSKKYYDASHHCWALRVGDPCQPLERFADAGEPAGTAGRPIMDQIRKFDLVNLIVIVTRWFGGTKLGKGGLVRAYGNTAALALKTVKFVIRRPLSHLTAHCDYDRIGLVEKLAGLYEGKVIDGQYGVEVELTVELPSFRAQTLAERLVDESAGRIRVTIEHLS